MAATCQGCLSEGRSLDLVLFHWHLHSESIANEAQQTLYKRLMVTLSFKSATRITVFSGSTYMGTMGFVMLAGLKRWQKCSDLDEVQRAISKGFAIMLAGLNCWQKCSDY